jgi:hypothetical protein
VTNEPAQPTNVGSNDQIGVSDEYVLTTVLEFADRAEGQVLHRGTQDECRKLSDMMPAVMLTGGGESPSSARHLIVRAAEFDMPAGERWRCRRPDA